jgi:hypothetical protein
LVLKWVKQEGLFIAGRDGVETWKRLSAYRNRDKVVTPQIVKPRPLTSEEKAEKARSAAKAYYQANREQLLKYRREYFKTLPEEKKAKRNASCRKWNRINREYKKEWDRRYREANPGQFKAYRKKARSNPKVRAAINVRRRIRRFLKNGARLESTAELVGCSRQDLMAWLASKFKKGMSWNNYGEWHIDHIMPLAVFDLKDERQRKMANHFTNLQPLWADENMEKADQITNPQFQLAV